MCSLRSDILKPKIHSQRSKKECPMYVLMEFSVKLSLRGFKWLARFQRPFHAVYTTRERFTTTTKFIRLVFTGQAKNMLKRSWIEWTSSCRMPTSLLSRLNSFNRGGSYDWKPFGPRKLLHQAICSSPPKTCVLFLQYLLLLYPRQTPKLSVDLSYIA